MKVLVQRMTCRDRVVYGVVTGRVLVGEALSPAMGVPPVWVTVWVDSKQPVLEVEPTWFSTQQDCDETYMHELEARVTFGWVPDGPPFMLDVPDLKDVAALTIQAWAGGQVYQAAVKAVAKRALTTVHQAYLDAIDEAVTL